MALKPQNNYVFPYQFDYNQQIPNYNNPYIFSNYFPIPNIILGPFNINQNNDFNPKNKIEKKLKD